MSQTAEKDKPYQSAMSASLSESFSDEESSFVAWQPRASAALFDLPEW